MPESLECPNCSAPLDLHGDGSATIHCPYCNTSVIIPADMRVIKPGNQPALAGYSAFNAPSLAELEEKMIPIREKAAAGDDIEAIKLLRETFVIGLKEAKELVEAIQRGEEIDIGNLQMKLHPQVDPTTLDSTTVQALADLINSGDKIEAIKLFRQVTGVGLKDAKDTIDAMEAGLSAQGFENISESQGEMQGAMNSLDSSTAVKASKSGRSCLAFGFVIFLIVTVVIPVLIAMTSQGGPLAGFWARINPFADGKVTMEFGEAGTGPGYFTDARFVSVDNNGHIFVGEFDGGRIQVFDEQGNYLTQWKATGEEQGDIYLSGMAADRNSLVYTVVGSELYVYEGMSGNLLGQLEHPEGWGFDDVTFAPDGSIVGTWYKNRDDLIRFDSNGQVDLLVEHAISNITNDSELDMHVAVDGTGNIYTLAYFNESVFVFAPDGRYISRFGSMGNEEGQFTSPRSIAVDNLGKIYIADFAGVMIYASDGRYLDTLPVNGAVMGITFDDRNNLYLVADEQVLRYTLK
jgi:ribosomal protein L7/L12/streptogramin lyase